MTFARYPSLQGKSAIVTGGASGIGEATVRAFSEQGARVGFVDMDAERGAALAAELGAAGHAVQFARCDLREVGELNVAFASLAKAHGPEMVPFEGVTYADWVKNRLYVMEHLKVGAVSPDIVGKDLDAVDFKLSDYRGKVVLLDFWGYW